MRDDVKWPNGFNWAKNCATLGVALSLLLASPLSAQTSRPFLDTLQKAGATPEELHKYSDMYDKMAPDDKAALEASSPAKLKADLLYNRYLWKAEAAHPVLKIGSPLPSFSLKGVDGKVYTPAKFKDAKVVVVAFLSNH